MQSRERVGRCGHVYYLITVGIIHITATILCDSIYQLQSKAHQTARQGQETQRLSSAALPLPSPGPTIKVGLQRKTFGISPSSYVQQSCVNRTWRVAKPQIHISVHFHAATVVSGEALHSPFEMDEV